MVPSQPPPLSRRFCFIWLHVLAVSAAATIASGAIAADAAKRQFDLPADAAEQSLKRLSIQSALQVVFASEITDGIRANAVKGEFTPMEAADRLLAGTSLRVTHDEKTGVLSVKRISTPERVSPEKKGQRAALTTAGDRPPTLRLNPPRNHNTRLTNLRKL